MPEGGGDLRRAPPPGREGHRHHVPPKPTRQPAEMGGLHRRGGQAGRGGIAARCALGPPASSRAPTARWAARGRTGHHGRERPVAAPGSPRPVVASWRMRGPVQLAHRFSLSLSLYFLCARAPVRPPREGATVRRGPPRRRRRWRAVGDHHQAEAATPGPRATPSAISIVRVASATRSVLHREGVQVPDTASRKASAAPVTTALHRRGPCRDQGGGVPALGRGGILRRPRAPRRGGPAAQSRWPTGTRTAASSAPRPARSQRAPSGESRVPAKSRSPATRSGCPPAEGSRKPRRVSSRRTPPADGGPSASRGRPPWRRPVAAVTVGHGGVVDHHVPETATGRPSAHRGRPRPGARGPRSTAAHTVTAGASRSIAGAAGASPWRRRGPDAHRRDAGPGALRPTRGRGETGRERRHIRGAPAASGAGTRAAQAVMARR